MVTILTAYWYIWLCFPYRHEIEQEKAEPEVDREERIFENEFKIFQLNAMLDKKLNLKSWSLSSSLSTLLIYALLLCTTYLFFQ